MIKFQTERLEIRPILPEDRDMVLDLLVNESVGKTYMLPEYARREDALPLFQRLVELSQDERNYVGGIYHNGAFIGLLNETEQAGQQIEMGYALLPDWQGRGFGTEAFAGAIAYLFSCGFETVIAGAFAENIASIRVMEKCGMVRQEYVDEIEYRGKSHTCVYYAIKLSEAGNAFTV